MPFQFKYERLLKLKVDEEQEKKNILAVCQNKKDQAYAGLEALKAQKADYESALASTLVSGVKVSEYQQMRTGETWFAESIESAKRKLRQAELDLITARVALVKATQEKKKYEKLKEIALDQYLQEEVHKESQFMDSLVTYKTSRKQRGQI